MCTLKIKIINLIYGNYKFLISSLYTMYNKNNKGQPRKLNKKINKEKLNKSYPSSTSKINNGLSILFYDTVSRSSNIKSNSGRGGGGGCSTRGVNHLQNVYNVKRYNLKNSKQINSNTHSGKSSSVKLSSSRLASTRKICVPIKNSKTRNSQTTYKVNITTDDEDDDDDFIDYFLNFFPSREPIKMSPIEQAAFDDEQAKSMIKSIVYNQNLLLEKTHAQMTQEAELNNEFNSQVINNIRDTYDQVMQAVTDLVSKVQFNQQKKQKKKSLLL